MTTTANKFYLNPENRLMFVEDGRLWEAVPSMPFEGNPDMIWDTHFASIVRREGFVNPLDYDELVRILT